MIKPQLINLSLLLELLQEQRKNTNLNFRLNGTLESLDDADKQLQDLNALFAARVNSLFELEEEVKKLRSENDRLWERQGITVCDKHFTKPVWPKALKLCCFLDFLKSFFL